MDIYYIDNNERMISHIVNSFFLRLKQITTIGKIKINSKTRPNLLSTENECI